MDGTDNPNGTNTHALPASSALREPRISSSTESTTSLILDNLHFSPYDRRNPSQHHTRKNDHGPSDSIDNLPYTDADPLKSDPLAFSPLDIEDPLGNPPAHTVPVDKKYKRWLLVIGALCLAGWAVAFALFVISGSWRHRSAVVHDPHATGSLGSGRKITMEQLQTGAWAGRRRSVRWVGAAGADATDGLMLEVGGTEGGFVTVADVAREGEPGRVLMREGQFQVDGQWVVAQQVWPSPDLARVLVLSERQGNWRHSFTGQYWIWDVERGVAEALDPGAPAERVQLVEWSPASDALAFVRGNDVFVRRLGSPRVERVTEDGGEEMFNGVPDWVYEEEVFSGNSATWWSEDGRYLAFLRTNETQVAEYPVQYFRSRPSGTQPERWMENYPEVRQIKYPKAGTPNPVVDLRFYDVQRRSLFQVPIEGDFADEDRLITEVVWAGRSGKVLVRETNRESDVLKMVVVDVERRSGGIVRTQDVNALDGGWFEVSETTTFIPSDPGAGRPHDGYIDTVIHEGYDHLAYFSPLEAAEPTMLTTGEWEVVDAPSAVDLQKNLVYFVATRDGSVQRHVYSVRLDGTDLRPVTDTSDDGYYDVSFSKGAGYALLSYKGPHIPWQKIISTPSLASGTPLSRMIEENNELSTLASATELPLKLYSTITVDGFELNVVERRPPHFSDRKKYPVLFYLYGGPGSQQVDQQFKVDFQSYIASTLGYVVVTVDGRGTGFKGRKTRCIIRGDIGHYESRDQIMAAKEWAGRKYVDATRMAIWGWSYGGFLTLKTLEQDAGETFQYGMAVAPVTDWLFYDSIYTERWMHMPQHNQQGYHTSAINNVTALAQNTRFLFMHGIADDNVHMQSSLTLIDKLDLAQVENYDVHFFPDSDHSIYFHGANRIVYDKLAWWLTNAFNGEWARIEHAVPLPAGVQVGTGNG